MYKNEHTLAGIGDHIWYSGREGIITGLCHLIDGTPAFNLVDADNEEQTCTAMEDDCITMDNWWHGNAISKSGIQY